MMTEIITVQQAAIETATAQDALIQIVLDSVTSQHTKRAYERALTDFLTWHTEQGQPPLTKALVQSYKVHLEGLGLGAASVNQRLSAIRKLASEASDNGLLTEQIANGIKNVSGVRQEGQRSGNWLSREQAQQLLEAPDLSTRKGIRDQALLAVLLGCGLRREEAAGLKWSHIQQRDGRWAIVDLRGKRGKVRTIPMPSWTKKALDEWQAILSVAQGYNPYDDDRVFVSINRGDNLSGDSMTAQAIRDVVVSYTKSLELGDVAPHDLRRTFAKLARRGGADLEQIQLSLGHASIQTTQRYLGTKQDFADAPADRLGLKLE